MSEITRPFVELELIKAISNQEGWTQELRLIVINELKDILTKERKREKNKNGKSN